MNVLGLGADVDEAKEPTEITSNHIWPRIEKVFPRRISQNSSSKIPIFFFLPTHNNLFQISTRAQAAVFLAKKVRDHEEDTD